jgi:hypothetical protein
MDISNFSIKVVLPNPPDQRPNAVSVNCMTYLHTERKFVFIKEVDLDKGIITQGNIPYEDLRNLVLAAQTERRKTDFVDSEGTDHKALLNDILKHIDDQENNIQVLDGGIDTVKLEHFPCDNVASVVELVHFIEVNNLTEVRPWSAIWNLYRCMLIAAKR